MSDENRASIRITGGQVMLVNGDFVEADLVLTDGIIERIGDGTGGHKAEINVAGMLVLPGIIDLHGDAFERQIMPRPGVSFAYDLALKYTDRQLVACGITTAYHGVTYSWEPGLRSRDVVVSLMAAMEESKGRFGCDTRFHLRFETYNLDVVDEVANWLEAGRVDLLAFNNHMPSFQEKIMVGNSIAPNAQRAGVTEGEFMALVDSLASREADVPAATERLAGIAREFDVPMASHDDRTPEIRRYYNALGCSIAEFPLSIDASKESRRLGNWVILGSPNILRGGSHMGSAGINAAEAIAQGRGDILVSDYYYPALAQAPFVLAEKGILDLAEAWCLVSANPARAVGLSDRGELAPGKRADLVIVKWADDGPVEIAATFVAGCLVNWSGLV